jgi:hypothetical protein
MAFETEREKSVHLSKKLASDILTGLMNGTYEAEADEPALGGEDFQDWINEIADLKDEHGPDMVVALAEFAESWLHTVIRSHEVDDFAEQHFKGSGHSKGEVLKNYARQDDFGLGKLWAMLDESDGMDCFNWDDYADSNSGLVNGLAFIGQPATGNADTMYLFVED